MMTSLMKNFRTAILTLSATILVVSQAVAAGGGQGGHAHGQSAPSIQTSLNAPLRGVTNNNTTINSSSGPVLARTANNLATSTVLLQEHYHIEQANENCRLGFQLKWQWHTCWRSIHRTQQAGDGRKGQRNTH